MDVPERFVHLWAAEPGARPLEHGLLSVLELGRALGRRQDRETDLVVVTAGAEDVLGTEPLEPLSAAVAGLCRVIPQEYPLVSCRTVDVLGEPAAPTEALAGPILAEIGSRSAEAVVAWRGRYRWVPVFDPIGPAEAPPAAARLRRRGVYLVTGGLGNVGLALGAHLARTVEARLVLTGRSGFPDREHWDARLAAAPAGDPVARRIRAVRAIEKAGGEVLVTTADAASLDEMRAAIALARERFGRIDGAIHAAGEVGAGALLPLAQSGREDCERQLRPKLGGAEVLDELLGAEPLDFVLLTSSLSTVLGGLSLGAYAAANRALDAFARRQQQRGRRGWTSVCWDAWRFGPAESGRLASTAISAEEGGEVLALLVTLRPHAQVVVSTTPLAGRVARWTHTASAVDREAKGLPDPARHARPELGAAYRAPEGAIEIALAATWADLLGLDRVGADDNFFELGGSSLLAVHMMGRVRKDFPADVSVATLFEAPTVRALARLVHGRRADPGLSRSEDRGRQRGRERREKGRTSDAAVE